MSIAWSRHLEIGVAAIDEDHKQLVSLINTYEDAIAAKSLKKLQRTFEDLIDYCHAHFEREESLMKAVHYPYRTSHRESHEDLLMNLLRLHRKILHGKKLDLPEISDFLRSWIVDHIINEDLPIRRYVKGGRTVDRPSRYVAAQRANIHPTKRPAMHPTPGRNTSGIG